jgi:hypothetical protein
MSTESKEEAVAVARAVIARSQEMDALAKKLDAASPSRFLS